MIYVTVPQSPIYKQISFEDILNGKLDAPAIIRTNEGNTRTVLKTGIDISEDTLWNMMGAISAFNTRFAHLFDVPRGSLYHTFYIPKSSGGLRRIDAPNDELKDALTQLRSLFEKYFGALYHTAAFAYVKGRSTTDAVKKHQQNNSNWFMKLDFHDFFGSTSEEYVNRILSMVAPFHLMYDGSAAEKSFRKALSLCFLNGGLPQGTPISPMLTNIVMIPIDYMLSKQLRNYKGAQFVYTRYADDMLISSYAKFNPREIEELVRTVLKLYAAPYTFKPEKTRFGSKAGSNWNLGVMLNKDNNITVGHKNKKSFRAMAHNYIMDRANGIKWSVNDVQTMRGLLSYYTMIEPEYFDGLIKSLGSKYNVDIMAAMRADMSYVPW